MKYVYCALTLFLLARCAQKSVEEPITNHCSFLGELENPDRFECGYLNVPENHSNPMGKKSRLRIQSLKVQTQLQRSFRWFISPVVLEEKR